MTHPRKLGQREVETSPRLTHPRIPGLPFFGLLGFIGASIAGLWLLWSILRSGGGR